MSWGSSIPRCGAGYRMGSFLRRFGWARGWLGRERILTSGLHRSVRSKIETSRAVSTVRLNTAARTLGQGYGPKEREVCALPLQRRRGRTYHNGPSRGKWAGHVIGIFRQPHNGDAGEFPASGDDRGCWPVTGRSTGGRWRASLNGGSRRRSDARGVAFSTCSRVTWHW